MRFRRVVGSGSHQALSDEGVDLCGGCRDGDLREDHDLSPAQFRHFNRCERRC